MEHRLKILERVVDECLREEIKKHTAKFYEKKEEQQMQYLLSTSCKRRHWRETKGCSSTVHL